MSLKIVMQEIPEELTVVHEVFVVRMKGEGIVTQGQLCFSRREATKLAECLNRTMPGTATVLGPFIAQGE